MFLQSHRPPIQELDRKIGALLPEQGTLHRHGEQVGDFLRSVRWRENERIASGWAIEFPLGVLLGDRP
jgi:hypothetical protein